MKIEDKEGNYVSIESYIYRVPFPYHTLDLITRLIEVLAEKEILDGTDIIRIVENDYREAQLQDTISKLI